jgi:hypothetical protein
MPIRNEADKVRECYDQAGHARLQWREALDDETRRALSEIEEHWLRLARSYQCSSRLDDLLKAQLAPTFENLDSA